MSKAAIAFAASSGFQAFTSIRQSQAQAAQLRVQAQAAQIKADFEARQNKIALQKETNEIKENGAQILKDLNRQVSTNIALGAASGFLKENVLNSKIIEEGLSEFLTSEQSRQLLKSQYGIIGEMLERQALDEKAQATQAAVNTENLGLLNAGGYLAQGYLNYQRYKNPQPINKDPEPEDEE